MPVCCEPQIGCACFFGKMRKCMVDMQFLHGSISWLSIGKEIEKTKHGDVENSRSDDAFVPFYDGRGRQCLESRSETLRLADVRLSC